ncbi:hypothetical protein OH76DRAFT_1404109 [Lentinus brumalis]|uniref:Fungal pheromone STE3G-protein-coupled receptor n=1 Tax=Lentinus brumalis TaxID=2498619 RepID=A0A371D8R4_9APHY|nr:hypothetical protein OH76DRAFT_1404109 [Polyporus brumalis]
MSTDSAVPELSLPPVPPAIQALLTANVNLLVIETVFPTLLVPIAVGLFLFSTPELRRKPVFILNIIAIVLGLLLGSIAVYCQTGAASGRLGPTELITVQTCLYFLIPICVQCILLIRIIAVYPPYSLSWTRGVLIYGTLGAIMVARIINVSFSFHKIDEAARRLRNWEAVGHIAWVLPNSRVEWILQLFYDVFASMLFLLRLHRGNVFRARAQTENGVVTTGRKWSYAARLRALFWIALSNFVLPVIFNVALLIMVYSGVNDIRGADVVMVNPYMEIVGVLLATLVCSGTQWGDVAIHPAREDPISLENCNYPTDSLPSIKFASSSRLTSQGQPDVSGGRATV